MKNMQYAEALTEFQELEEKVKSSLVSRNITVQGRRTSVRLEPEMWTALREISKREGCSIHDVCTLVSLRKKENTSLTAAIRVFLMLYFRAATNEDGHKGAGHGNFAFMLQRARIREDEISPDYTPKTRFTSPYLKQQHPSNMYAQ